MIYLILSAGFKDNNPDRFEKRLKIGYTDNLENRLKAYLTTNPDFILLQTREGDISFESHLHKKFEKYRYKDSKEWFYYNQEIIDYFQNEVEDFIDENILLEYIKKDLRSKIASVPELREKYLNQILDEIKSRKDFKEELYNERIFIRVILDVWELGINMFNKAIDNIELVNFQPIDLSKINNPEITVDITLDLDLPQILGRQRLLENPWKNRAELYFKSIIKKNIVTKEEFDKYISNKLSKTENLLLSYKSSPTSESKHDLADTYQKVAKTYNYKDDYVAVNTHGGTDLFPVRNELVLISERRAFDIQQVDYKDRFTVFNKLADLEMISYKIQDFIKIFNTLSGFHDKMKAICESSFSETEKLMILEQVPILYKNMYLQFGPVRLKAKSYNITNLRKELEPPTEKEDITKTRGYIDSKNEILNHFSIGSRYTLTYIKETLGNIYRSIGYKKTPKASDLIDHFNLKKVVMVCSGKKSHGYEILSKKD